MKTTEEEEKYFQRVVDEEIILHPFSSIRYVALGWLRREGGLAFFGNHYSVTDDGMAVVRKHRKPFKF